MNQFFTRTRMIWLVSAVFVAAMSGGIVSGLATRWLTPAAADHPLADGFFRAINAHASATNAQESMILATGEIDTAIEGVFTLDALTGELRGAVISPQKGRFTVKYSWSVAKDFEGVKNPKFLMVTGVAEMRQQYGPGARPAHCVIYVAEVTSGKVAAYGVPFDNTKATGPQGYKASFIPLDVFSARDVAVRN
jgi:hypothetical protein